LSGANFSLKKSGTLPIYWKMIRVQIWLPDAFFALRASTLAFLAAGFLSLSAHGDSSRRQPVDYLIRFGPLPLRFEIQSTQGTPSALPPLGMGSRTKTEVTNAGPVLAAADSRKTATNGLSLATNKIAKVQTNHALPAPLPMLSSNSPAAPVALPLDTGNPLFATPGGANESVLTPQMLVHFFQKNGTNGGTSIVLPVEVPGPDTHGKSSSATYVSP
jgi:hypothetical protein